MKYIIILIIIIIIIIILFIYNIIYYKENYIGLVLFDIDGTLSDGIENYEVVQYFLDRKYAVGISTAGRIYTPDNIKNYNWMPENLYKFMLKHKFNTFNNVSSNIICGKYNSEIFNIKNNIDNIDNIYEKIGYLKGITLYETSKIYKITNKIFLLDNDPSYIKGINIYNNIYNNKYKIICAGKPCSNNNLSLKTLKNIKI
jgi:hypothetical protein